ncbi:MAG: LPP20 family lipoprotein [Gammaproteobacteria bacterium]|nr:LPP20 family lipoprotein [Gammaproteobacteria bacterium]
MKVFLNVVLSAVLLTACASPMPDWVNSASKKYPSEQYLIGRGQAPKADEARDRARADLAKIFEVSVTVESQDVQIFRLQTAKDKTAKSADEYPDQTSRQIITRADQIIEAIQIADVWRDPQIKTYHALAILPRQQATQRLRQEIARLDAVTGTYLETARNSGDPLRKIGATQQALDAQMQRVGYQKSLRNVDPVAQEKESAWSTAQLNADLSDLLKRAHIAVKVKADMPKGFAAQVERILAAAGFLIDTGEKPDYVLDTQLTLEDLGWREGQYWQRGILLISLRETANERVRGSKQWDIKAAAAPDHAVSIQRARDQAVSILRKELRDSLLGFAAP